MTEPKTFRIEVGDEEVLKINEIWPDGDAPENPTRDDVIAAIKRSTTRFRFMSDWNFEAHVYVDGKLVEW